MTNRPDRQFPPEPSQSATSAARRSARRAFAGGFALLALLAVAPLATAQEGGAETPDGPNPTEVLFKARKAIEGYRTLSATLKQVVAFSETTYIAEGRYLQSDGNRVRVTLEANAGGLTGSLEQICDGDILWTIFRVGETPRALRRDVRQILDASEKRGPVVADRMLADLGLGGLPGLLAAIQQNTILESAERVENGGRSFVVVEGRWNDGIVNTWRAQVPAGRDLPRYVTERVELTFDEEHLVPYRVRFLRRRGTFGDPAAPLEAVVTLELRDVAINTPLDPTEFTYLPPDDLEFQDVTGAYIQRIDAAAR